MAEETLGPVGGRFWHGWSQSSRGGERDKRRLEGFWDVCFISDRCDNLVDDSSGIGVKYLNVS